MTFHWWCAQKSVQWRLEYRVGDAIVFSFLVTLWQFCVDQTQSVLWNTHVTSVFSPTRMDPAVLRLLNSAGQAAKNSRLLYGRLRQEERKGENFAALPPGSPTHLVRVRLQPVFCVSGSGAAEEGGWAATGGRRGLGNGHKRTQGHQGPPPQRGSQPEDPTEGDEEKEEEGAHELLHLAAQKHSERT